MCGADGVFTLYADTEPVATIALEGMSKEQVYLMTAAPELTDIARDVVEEYLSLKGTVSVSTKIVELIWRLRDAGIPVAESYKGGRNTPPYDVVYDKGQHKDK